MELEELQQIWHQQDKQHPFTINEKEMSNYITSKKKKALLGINVSELSLIIINVGVACFILNMNLLRPGWNLFLLLIVIWQFMTALFVLVNRLNRVKAGRRFDKSMLGDLRLAVDTASWQVRLSQFSRWNLLPICILVVLSLSGKKTAIGWIALMGLFFALAYFVSRWEHRHFKARKRELEALQDKLLANGAGHEAAAGQPL